MRFSDTAKILLIGLLGSVSLISLVEFIESFGDREYYTYNAYFYDSNEREVYLGVVKGLAACQSSASGYANSTGLSNSEWSYICCRKTSASECASKHK